MKAFIQLRYLAACLWCLGCSFFFLLLQRYYLFRADKYHFLWSMRRSRFFDERIKFWLSKSEALE